MLRILILLLAASTPVLVAAQNKWGYCFAGAKRSTTDSSYVKFIFISELVAVRTLKCDTKNLQRKTEEYNEALDACISDWFYKRVEANDSAYASMLEKDNIQPETRVCSNLEWMHKTNYDESLHFKYLTKKEAAKRRNTYVNAFRSKKGSHPDGSTVVLIN